MLYLATVQTKPLCVKCQIRCDHDAKVSHTVTSTSKSSNMGYFTTLSVLICKPH